MTACRHWHRLIVWTHNGQDNPSATGIGYTRHGETRMRQRGMRKGDVDLILACGTQVDAETWFLRKRDVDRAIESHKQEIQALQRLRNRKVVVRDGRVSTAYPSRPSDQKHTLRRGRRKGLHNGQSDMKKRFKCVVCRKMIPSGWTEAKPNAKTCSWKCSQFWRPFGPEKRRNRNAQSQNKCAVCPRTISPTRKRSNPNAPTCSWNARRFGRISNLRSASGMEVSSKILTKRSGLSSWSGLRRSPCRIQRLPGRMLVKDLMSCSAPF